MLIQLVRCLMAHPFFFDFLDQVQIQSSNQNHFAEAGLCSVTVATFVLCCGGGGVPLQFDIGAGARFKDT